MIFGRYPLRKGWAVYMQRQVCITRDCKLAKSQPLTVTKSTTNYYANGICGSCTWYLFSCVCIYTLLVPISVVKSKPACRTVYFVLFERFHAANVYTVFLQAEGLNDGTEAYNKIQLHSLPNTILFKWQGALVAQHASIWSAIRRLCSPDLNLISSQLSSRDMRKIGIQTKDK